MSLFEATKKRSNDLEKLFHASTTITPKSVEPERDFSAMGLFVAKLRNTEWWKCVLIVMRQYYKHHWKAVLNLINNSLLNCTGTNSSNFTMTLRKTWVFLGFFSQLPKTQVLKFCPKLETLVTAKSHIMHICPHEHHPMSSSLTPVLLLS